MPPQSQRWESLATYIAQGYGATPDIAGIVLGGSVGRGLADANFDVDIFVFCHRFPTDKVRQTAIRRVDGERWKAHDNKRDQSILRDCFHADDGRIDIEFILVDLYESIVHDVLVDCDIARAEFTTDTDTEPE